VSRAVGVGSYRSVLSLPFALRTFVPALGGRLAYGLLPLATLFTILHATGSYATAGLALALFGLTSIALPAKARLADRFGQRRTLPVLALLCAAALTAAVTTRSPTVLVTLIGLAGLAAPPLGPAMRSTWRVLTQGTTLKERAYGLDSVAEETLYLVGPLLTGLIVATGPARNALLATAVLLAAGTVGMVLAAPAPPSPAASLLRPPVASPSPAGSVSSAPGRSASPPPRSVSAPPAEDGLPAIGPTRRRWDVGPLRSPGLWPVLAVLLVAGAGVSVAYTAAAAVAQSHHRPGAAGWLEAAAALGGVTGGLGWARRRHRHGRIVHLAGLLTVQAAAVLLSAAATGSLPVLSLIMALGGAAVAPIYVVAYLAADDLAPDGRGTEAGTWVNVAGNAGSAAGSAGAGLLVQFSGPVSAFLTAGLVLAASALITAALAARRGAPPRRPRRIGRPVADQGGPGTKLNGRAVPRGR
jgi:predicted MFS family arabinose efflux permease